MPSVVKNRRSICNPYIRLSVKNLKVSISDHSLAQKAREMAAGLVVSAVQTLFNALECKELRAAVEIFGYKSRLEELQGSVETIRAVLLDAEAKEEQLSHEARIWVDKLKHAVYDADDLLDEFITITQQEKQMAGGNISRKVRRFLSDSNQLLVAFNMSKEIKMIRKTLDSIANNHTKFGLSVMYQPRRRREETWSYVDENSVIGREGDKEAIVNMLLQDSHRQADVSFVTIVGMGGLGKTTLAQIAYNDDRIKSAFQLRLWVYVSQEFSVKEILGNILRVAAKQNHDGMEDLHREVRRQIQGKRYLLVLDDVWDENRHDWVKLREFLIVGARGSRILVTTRSKNVAAAVGEDPMYELCGLSKEKSWLLFKNMAFKEGQEDAKPDLVEIGKDIIEKCANVPLAIRVAGSMLYGQDKSKWLLFKNNHLAKFGGEDGIMPTLKLSYHNLSSPLKSCFSFCALFPKDYVIDKTTLISLWLAHGCIVPHYEGQSVEDVGEEYFLILLQRCFFQETRQDEYGEITSCKMHDLIHDLAVQVAGSEYLMLPSSVSPLRGSIRHLSISNNYLLSPTPNDNLVNMKRLRTFLDVRYDERSHHASEFTLLQNSKHLRVLYLNGSSLRDLPNMVGTLLHLRYLDLSHNNLQKLPKWITRLHNLRVLKLRHCSELKELPSDLSKLINLRLLDVLGCDKLSHMPAGLGKLTCLQTLTMFVVGEASSKKIQIGQLKDLKPLVNLRGDLHIEIREHSRYDALNIREGTNVLERANLRRLSIKCEKGDQGDLHKALLDGLQPHCSVKELRVKGYGGVRLPSWASALGSTMRTFLPYLVRIILLDLPKVQYLPSMSQLPHLKYLQLENMPNVEYLEENNGEAAFSVSRSATEVKFFPSLEELRLKELPKLKGWWRESLPGGVMDVEVPGGGAVAQDFENVVPSCPCLHKLEIFSCENMAWFPTCPQLKELRLIGEEVLRLGWRKRTRMRPMYGSATNSLCKWNWGESLESIALDIPNVEYQNWLPQEFVGRLVSLTIEDYNHQGWSWSSIVGQGHEQGEGEDEGHQRCVPSPCHLVIYRCMNIRSLTVTGVKNFTNLEHLKIDGCADLAIEEDEDGMPWKSLHRLSSLVLDRLPQMVNLPYGLQYLTALQSLQISRCINLIGLPEWLGCLSSLQSLHICACSSLKSLPEAMHRLTSLRVLEIQRCFNLAERCQDPSGEDWLKICHISDLVLSDASSIK